MARPEEYLLRFDFEKLRSQLADASRAYTDLGTSLQTLIGSTSDDLSTLQEKASNVSITLSGVTPQIERSSQGIRLGSAAARSILGDISQYSDKVSNDLSRLQGVKLMGFEASTQSPQVRKDLAKAQIISDLVSTSRMASKEVQAAVKVAVKDIRNADKVSAKVMNHAKDYFKSEIKEAGGQVRGVMSHVPGGVLSGGIMGGLIGAMVLGYTEKDRLRAQSGEILNVFEATGESFSDKASKKARGFFKGFQESAQWFYGVTKAETQSVLKSMVDAGYKSKDTMIEYDKSLGLVGKNVTIASIAADKHFNQQTGTSMKNIIQLTTSLGDSLGTATDKYVKLAFAGQRSGMGISNFVDSVISGSSAMQQYGVDVENVASVMVTIQKHYKDMGLDPRYAGGQAQQVIGGMAQGLANLNPSMKAVLAQQMFPELSALDALQRWEDGFLRAGDEGGNDFMQRALVEFQKWASEGGRSRSQAIRLMEYQGLDNRTAATVVDLGEKLARTNDLKTLDKNERKRMREAFQTEGQRISGLHKTQRRLYAAIKDIGGGLLKVLVGLVGVLALGIKSIPSIINAALASPAQAKEELTKIATQMDLLESHIGVGVADIVKGVSSLPGIGAKEFGDDLKPIIDSFGYKVFLSGGEGVATSFGDVGRQTSEVLSQVKQLMTDADFRRQVMEQGAVDGLRLTAFAVGLLPGADTPEEWSNREAAKKALRARADMLEEQLMGGGDIRRSQSPSPSTKGAAKNAAKSKKQSAPKSKKSLKKGKGGVVVSGAAITNAELNKKMGDAPRL